MIKPEKESSPDNCREEIPMTGDKPPGLQILPMASPAPVEDVPCCGPPAGPPADPMEKPGYTLCTFVRDFINTPVGLVPRVKTKLEKPDIFGTIAVRIGKSRNDYRIAPGLYGLGDPDQKSPVLVTASYKLSFDALRKELDGLDAWILVLDTHGINVWCAAGKGTFGTEELVSRIKRTGLDQVVEHRQVILPQLGAVGVSAFKVKKESGFKVLWGPIKASDIKAFIQNENKADETMRRVTFSMAERLVLAPLEISMSLKPLLYIIPAIFILAGLGPDIFSGKASLERGLVITAALLTGILTGTIVLAALLPWIPGRAFSLKGAITGLVGGLVILVLSGPEHWSDGASILLISSLISSYLAMNFTGSTPFTSPSGVEKEMRRAIPIQAVALLVAAIVWIGGAFMA